MPRQFSTQSRKVAANGHTFHVEMGGRSHSDIPVFCMPGALGTAQTDFFKQLEGLNRSVISFDPRGYGQSRPPTRSFTPDFYHRDADDVAGIMKEMGYETFDVMGWSDGANAAVILAAKHPGVRRLILFGGNSYVVDQDIQQYRLTADVERDWSERMRATHKPVYGDELQPLWTSFINAMEEIHRLGGDICQAEAKSIKCPTLVLHGLKDPIVPTFHAEWFRDNIRGCRYHVFPDGKHNIHIKYGEEVNRIVDEFLS